MPKRFCYCLWWFGLCLLLGCNNGNSTLPTVIAPAATLEQLPTAVALPPTNTPIPTSTAMSRETLTAVDVALQEIDSQVCQEAHAARAEIEAMLQQGQDVADLAAAIDELIGELAGCAQTPTPAP